MAENKKVTFVDKLFFNPRTGDALREIVTLSMDKFTGSVTIHFQEGIEQQIETHTKSERKLRKALRFIRFYRPRLGNLLIRGVSCKFPGTPARFQRATSGTFSLD